MRKFISFFLYIFIFLFIFPSLAFFLNIKIDEFSFENLLKILSELKNPLINTVVFGFCVTFFATTIGISLFWLTNFHNFPFVNIFRYTLFLPIIIPPYISGYADGYFFEYNEQINKYFNINFRNYYGATFVLSLTFYPYIYILMQSLTNKLQNTIIISKLHGIKSTKTLFSLVFSSSRPIIIFSISIVFMEVIGEYGLSNHYGLNNVSNFLYREWFQGKNYSYASISGIIIFFFIALILVFEEKDRQNRNYSNNLQHQKTLRPKFFLTKWQKFVATTFCLTIFVFSFAIPVYQLIIFAIEKFQQQINKTQLLDLMKLTYNTIYLAAIISFLTVAFGYCINFFFNANKNHITKKINNILKTLVIFAYGIPGSFVAISIIIWVQWLTKITNTMIIKTFFFTTIGGIVYGCLFRFINIAIYTINSGISSQKRELIWCNKIFSKNKIKLFFWSVPIFFKEILIVYLIILIDSIKELPITLLLRPFNFDNLTTKTYDFVSDERYEDAAIPAILTIILLSVLSIIFIKFINKQK
jgi:iron(III) transport system permease protein